MGTLTLSGVLKRPISGDVVPNARITFDAIATGNVVLKGVSSSCKTASDGSYSVDLEYGDYTIQVSWAGQTQQYGTVHIDDTTPTGSLNDLLMQELTESQLTPEIVLEFRQLEQEMQDDLAQMEDLNNEAAGSASAAASSATAAATSEAKSAASEDAAAVSASAADASAKSIEGDADAAAASAKAAATSETNAAASEDAAASSATAANTSETNAAGSEADSAASAAAAQVSESNSAASETASGASAAAAKTSETNAQASQEAAATSETNAKNARDAAEEYAQEAKDAASKVTSPLTDQGLWAIQAGYPSTPDIASVWQITDGGADPVNSDIIWDPGDMLVYLATTGTWCRLLGQRVVAGEPVPLKIDADIILNVGSGLQIVTSGTTAVDVVRLDADNNLVLGADALPGICLKTAEPTSLFVMVSDGSGGYTKSRIYSESFPPPQGNYLTEAQGDTLYFKQDELLKEIADAGADAQSESRQNLGLGDAANKNVGTTVGTVAAGDDSRFDAGLTWDDIHPVGSEFSSYTDSRNPLDILGFGTWLPVVGLIAGVGAATDSQGYTANYTAGYQPGWWRVQNGHIVAQTLGLAMELVPDHQHAMQRYGDFEDNKNAEGGGSYAEAPAYSTHQTDPAGGHTPSGTVTIGTGTAIDSAAFFNPYYGKYIWVRTA
ncbi:prophage tail fiber N-terminal domain-containing protein [Citrobacter freundii]|nr:prophage tail fiber N-terminal domain-containing protein [Citrobacter freundii]